MTLQELYDQLTILIERDIVENNNDLILASQYDLNRHFEVDSFLIKDNSLIIVIGEL